MNTKLFPLLLFTFNANAADLATTFSSTYSKVSVNNAITYTGSVVNKGVDAASNVQLIFYIPPKNVSIGNLPPNCYNANTKLICSLGNLNVGDSATQTVSVFYIKKGTNFISVNAVTDSNDTNYSNNSTRLTTNVTDSTNTPNLPLIPNVVSAKVNPTSILQGNTLTFSANLDAPLPNGYSVKVNYDGNYYVMNGSGTNYSFSNSLNTAGMRTFRTGVYDNFGSLKGSEMTGTFEVTKPNTPPTLSIISGADTAIVSTAYTLQLQANDVDGNLSNIQITNWGDGASESQIASNGTNVNFSHTFNSAGNFTVSAIANDAANASSTPISKTINVTAPQYTKIANDGSELPATAQLGTNPKDWACTKDIKTGLIWEVKTTDGGLRDWENTYSWYEPDANKNGGYAGKKNDGSCNGSECDIYAFKNAVNQQSLCGATDWRVPSVKELEKLLTKTSTINQPFNKQLYIDASYFPNTNQWFWSSSPLANYSDYAWGVYFSDGGSNYYSKDYYFSVRLVR